MCWQFNSRFFLLFVAFFCSSIFLARPGVCQKPHAVFVVGTTHYSPEKTIPGLAAQLESTGFRTSVIVSQKNPERDPKGLAGLEKLRDADVAVFYTRFLTLPDDQLKHITDYIQSGKPVVGFRTSTHAFAYPDDSKHAHWNDGFGKRVLGSKYFAHLGGKTDVKPVGSHAILKLSEFTNPKPASGSLYLAEVPDDATVLLRGTGQAKRVGKITNAFGTHHIEKTMTQDVAWTWRNEWGGRVFATTLGHPDTFKDPGFVRFFLSGIHWAADRRLPRKFVTQAIDGRPIVKKRVDARNTSTGKPDPPEDPALEKFAIYEQTAPRPSDADPLTTTLPLRLNSGDRIALIGNTLFERSQWFGNFESMLHQRFPDHNLIVRHLAWSADAVDIEPRPANFADTIQHLTHEKVDVVFVAYGFNESFAGKQGLDEFREALAARIAELKSKAFNGRSAAKIILVSPVANENVEGVDAADRNNAQIEQYVSAMQQVAEEQQVGFANVFSATKKEMDSPGSDLTINGVHLNSEGDQLFSRELFRQTIGGDTPTINPEIRATVTDKNRQYFRRFRPLNTFYYTGGRNKSYGYLDFLPAMRNFDQMVANRDQRIWDLARGVKVPESVDDSNVPPLPMTKQARGANRWMTAADEQKEFTMDPRFDVNLFAGEEQFPDIANPIQMRWDSRGRLWVSCSTTYPHVYPGNEPNDKIVILEDTDGDGRADKSTVFADDLHIPLSFEFGDGGVYVSEQPNLTFLMDTDGDDVADVHKVLLSGFGTEDSHHSLHDLTFTPDGDLIFRESIFHHSQVETPYGPVRQQNSGWFRFDPRSHRLLSFGTYHSTNPWGVSFDDWGQHMASHPVYAAAFHALDPPYPTQHASPKGLQAYSGVCGHHMVDFDSFPSELKGHFIKVRYKPTNRVEIHQWVEEEFGFQEKYVGDLLFSSNLSFIPVDLQWGPRGALYVCDWYNPVKGHAQYSLRDERRDRHSGRIWRITAKDKPLLPMPKIADAPIDDLLDLLKRPEHSIRMLAKRELRNRDPLEVRRSLDKWVGMLASDEPRYEHHLIEAVWVYRWTGLAKFPTHLSESLEPLDSADSVSTAITLIRQLLESEDHHARAAATQQLRYWAPMMDDATRRLNQMANDANGIVRMEAVIAASYIGTQAAFEAVKDVFNHPKEGHLQYAITCAMGSRTLRPFWENDPSSGIEKMLRQAAKANVIKEPTPSAVEAQFDRQKDLKQVSISCIPERMLFSVKEFTAKPGQPVKIVFTNPDATDHNLVVVKPGALADVGMAANEMAKDPRNAKSDFIPREKRDLILHASKMIGPTRASLVHVLRFHAPEEPGIYPYVCTFPGHWVVMNGVMVVAENEASAKELLAQSKPQVVRQWSMTDFADLESISRTPDTPTVARGMTAFVKARCNQCHVIAGHGVNLGPDLRESVKKLKGMELLKQMIEPSSQIHPDFQNHQFLLDSGQIVTGVIVQEDQKTVKVVTNLLTPSSTTTIRKKQIESQKASKVSPMPSGLLDVLTKDEILDLQAFVQSGGYNLPKHIEHQHQHSQQHTPAK